MTQSEILQELKKLTSAERLAIIEAALRLIREDLRAGEPPPADTDRKEKLTRAAQSLLADYKADEELTAFTALDSEAFCAKGGTHDSQRHC